MKNATLVTTVVALALTLSACTAIKKMEAKDTDDLLVAAGFTIKSADTPEALAKLKQLKPLTMVRRVKDNQMYYTYADPYSCQCLFVGQSEQYMEYKRLAFKQQIASEQLETAEAEEDAAMNMGWWWW